MSLISVNIFMMSGRRPSSHCLIVTLSNLSLSAMPGSNNFENRSIVMAIYYCDAQEGIKTITLLATVQRFLLFVLKVYLFTT